MRVGSQPFEIIRVKLGDNADRKSVRVRFGASRSGHLTVYAGFYLCIPRVILPLCKLYKRSAFCSKMAEICGLEHGRNRDLYIASVEKNTKSCVVAKRRY